MRNVIQKLTKGLTRIAFPNVCVCCGHENTQQERQLCSFCMEDRFEDANPDNERVSSDSLLPEGILVQHALWKFDKGGDLQNLLHQLKYERLTNIAVDLGRKLGQRVANHPFLAELFDDRESVILPVPLHFAKYRYRGFNQAFKLAQGFQEVWEDMCICGIKDVVRTKNTLSQTGFSLKERLQNMENAFKIRNKEMINGKVVVIIDDVFTTGATTFELAQSLRQAEAGPIVILTVAQA